MSKSGKGQCLCGAVKIEAAEIKTKVGACHCSMCRKWSGGPFMGVECGAEHTLEGQEHIGVYDSSDWAERGFCKKCGTHLFYRLKSSPKLFVPVALFDGLEGLVFDHQYFIDQKPSFYCFSNKTNDLTGPELFAMFNAS